MNDEKLLEAVKKVAHVAIIGQKGGKAFTDNPMIVRNGPISEIQIYSGNEIDNIQVSYGGEPGETHGGNGGVLSKIEIKKGYNITSIHAREGLRVDSLQFISKNAKGETEKSEIVGGKGGKQKIIRPPKGLVLREIRGRVGDRVDQLEFIFGFPCYVENLILDEEWVHEQLAVTTPRTLNTLRYKNINDKKVIVNFSESATENTTSSFNWQSTTAFTFGMTTSFGTPLAAAKHQFSFGASSQVTIGETTSETVKHTRSWNVPVPCEPKLLTVAKATIREAKLKNVPFSYDVVFYDGDKSNVKKRVSCYGRYSGQMLSSEAAVSWETFPINE